MSKPRFLSQTFMFSCHLDLVFSIFVVCQQKSGTVYSTLCWGNFMSYATWFSLNNWIMETVTGKNPQKYGLRLKNQGECDLQWTVTFRLVCQIPTIIIGFGKRQYLRKAHCLLQNVVLTFRYVLVFWGACYGSQLLEGLFTLGVIFLVINFLVNISIWTVFSFFVSTFTLALKLGPFCHRQRQGKPWHVGGPSENLDFNFNVLGSRADPVIT